MVKVKICGITNEEDALTAVGAGADALGFIFTRSPRQISPEDVRDIIEHIPPFVSLVGVFVDEQEERVSDIIQMGLLNAVQFHGAETPEYCLNFRRQVKVIKTFRVKDSRFLKNMAGYKDKVDAFLLDTYWPEKLGGTGETFNWELAAGTRGRYPYLVLAGGLNADNVAEAIKMVKPYGVDVSSALEAGPGKKDPQLVKNFIDRVKKNA